jgi:hypothetical protein
MTLSLIRQAHLVIRQAIVQSMSTQNQHLHIPKNANTRRQVFILQKVLSAIDQSTRHDDQTLDTATRRKRFQDEFLTEKASSLAAITSPVVVPSHHYHWHDDDSETKSSTASYTAGNSIPDEKRDSAK